MPPTRSVRQRVINNENDENDGSVRLTRAKTAALGGPEGTSAGIVKKALQAKKAATSSLTAPANQRKRAALGDVTNVEKNEAADTNESKKPTATSATLVSKAAQNAGVQKLSRVASTRSALKKKDNNKKPAASELKRPASGSGALGAVHKKRSTGFTASKRSIQESEPIAENEPPPKRSFVVEVEKRVNVETKEVLRVEDDLVHVVEDYEPEDEVQDLDADDHEDPLMVAEYAVEIFDYLRELEMVTMPNEKYMDHQTYLDWDEREILNDWLIQVHTKFQLLPETLYLTINIIDRFLSTKIVELEKLQLVGITAMFIASKYEEVMSPHVSNFSYIAKDYADHEILSAERFILSALNYDLSYPNPMNFLRRISKADNYDIQTRTLGKYLLEISICDQKFIEFCPSHIAAASMYMARLILEKGPWDATIAHYAGYSEEEIMPVVKLMVEYCSAPVKHQALHNKYASKKYLKASLLVRQWAKRYYPMYIEQVSASNAKDISALTSKDGNCLNAKDIKAKDIKGR